MAYIQGPYAEHGSLPVPTTTRLHSSRSIDFATRKYKLDSDGNHEGMDDIAQRVILTVAFEAPRPPKMISDGDFSARKQRIRAALVAMEKEGAIRVQRVRVERTAAGAGREYVDFVNLRTQQSKSVKLP